jgi:hypothetical protein
LRRAREHLNRKPEGGITALFCYCGKYFKTALEVGVHGAKASDSKRHGCSPDELKQEGGAFAGINRKTGKVLACKCFRLPNRSIGEANSTGAEASSVVEQARTLLEQVTADYNEQEVTAGTTEGGQQIVMYTDNQSTVSSVHTHITEGQTSLGRRFKASLGNQLRSLQTLADKAAKLDTAFDLKHDKHEHGRPWHLSRRTLQCRLNRCCDWAAGEAAEFDGREDTTATGSGAFADERSEHDDGTGGPTTVTMNGMKIEGNPKEIIAETISLQHLGHAAGGHGIQSQTPRLVMTEVLNPKLATEARTLMTAQTEEAAIRALFRLSNVSMSTVKCNARLSNGGGVAHAMFKSCGPLSDACAQCAKFGPKGEVHRDSHDH